MKGFCMRNTYKSQTILEEKVLQKLGSIPESCSSETERAYGVIGENVYKRERERQALLWQCLT